MMQHITDLPRPLLELILISSTSTTDKKALRQSCKFLAQIVDGSLTSLKLGTNKDLLQPDINKFLRRVQHADILNTVCLRTPHYVDSSLRHVPDSLTTLTICCSGVNLKCLKTLRGLTALHIFSKNSTGLEQVIGLTRLQCVCCGLVGSVAHLAPTLKHLSMWDYNHVEGMDQLTNLEVLEVTQGLPVDFFKTHSKLPLQHLCANLQDSNTHLGKPEAWVSAPTTLTRLSLRNATDTVPAGIHITHLQLLAAREQQIKQAAAALPGLRSLDVSIFINTAFDPFGCLSKFTNLQSLGVLFRVYDRTPWNRRQVLSLHEVSKAVARGVQLNVMGDDAELLGVLRSPLDVKTAWATHT